MLCSSNKFITFYFIRFNLKVIMIHDPCNIIENISQNFQFGKRVKIVKEFLKNLLPCKYFSRIQGR